MRWRGRRKSKNVEDRRGRGPGTGMAIGGVGIIIAIVVLLMGGDPSAILQGGGGGGGGGQDQQQPYKPTPAEQELAAARASLVEKPEAGVQRNIIIRAPVDGVVLRRLRESEAVVPAGEPLLEIADPADLEIVSDLLSSDAVKVRRGQKVIIERLKEWRRKQSQGGDTPA